MMPGFRPSFRAAIACAAALLIVESAAAIALAGEVLRVFQKNRAFSYNALTINKGDTLQFANDDEFIHQIYVKSDGFNVDTDESSPGTVITVPFNVSGTFEVHCHIHPKMRLVVTVK